MKGRVFNMREKLKQFRLSVILISLLYVILGFILLVWPSTSGIILCRTLGGTLLVCGLINILGYVLHERGGFMLELLFGVVAAAVGGFFLLFPMGVLSILPVIMGVYVAVDSLVALRRANELRRLDYVYWWVSLVLALVGIGLGAFLIFKPISVVDTVFRIIGGVFLYLGVSDLWSLFKLSQAAREMQKRSSIDIDPID